MTAPRNVTKIAISGAAGNIGYALLPMLASGYVFGRDSQVELRLLEIPQAIKSLSGIRMELLDCAFPCLVDVICTTDPLIAFDNADVIVLVGGFPRKQGMQRKDLIQANTKIFTSMGRAIDEVASQDVKVLVVANPANTNCLVALSEAPRIPSKNFCALSFLDHQRAKAQIAKRMGVPVNRVNNVTIWGNHSETQFPDALTDGHYINNDGAKIPLRSLMKNDSDWLENDFISTVQNRGKKVIEVRGSSSALSAAMGAADCLKTWLVTGTKPGETVSMAVYNDKGYYGTKPGVVFSFPCECRNGNWYVKENLALSEFAHEKIEITEKELIEEREAAQELIKTSLVRCGSSSSMSASESDADMSVSVSSKL